MNSRFVVSAIAAAVLCGALPALAQGSGADRNVPEIPNQQFRPADRSVDGAQAERPPRAAGPREQPRTQHARPEARRDHDHNQSDRRHWDHQGHDRRHWDHRSHERHHWDHHRHDRRSYGYVVPRPNYYYSPPPVFYTYSPPALYYGGLPQTYRSAPLVLRPGDFLPPEYRQQQYVVEDWQWRGLAAPPSGYHWLVLGPDYYLLVADSTGQILSMVATTR